MPVTAKLSRKFYDTFGDDLANELVDWLNAVDATYRADLRELNELNFGRFDAKLEQRLAELDAKWGGRWTELDAKLERRLAEMDATWGSRWTELDAKWGGRWTELDAKLERRLAEVRAALSNQIADGLAAVETKLVRWMVGLWATVILAMIGLSWPR